MAPREMDRRTMLKIAGKAAVGFGLAAGNGCVWTGRAKGPTIARKKLVPLRVSPESVVSTVVGLRPFRASGYVVRAERFGEKVIVHNYGHGGGGVTVSWGTAHAAVDEALKTGQRRAAVIGCGCIGLSTALLLQRKGWSVTVYTKDLPQSTTSTIAGALWSPFAVADRDRCAQDFAASLEKACRLSHRCFLEMTGSRYGIRWIENYSLGTTPPEWSRETTAIRDLYRDRSVLEPGENPFPAAHAERFSTLLIDMPVYLDALVRDLSDSGVTVVHRRFASIEELMNLSEPVIMNCTGLGSAALFYDRELVPVRGQFTIIPPQQDVDYTMIWRDEHLIMIPRSDGILLGGTYQPGDWSILPDSSEEKRILAGHARIFGSMKGDRE
jgi:D-amino-acid oxidase